MAAAVVASNAGSRPGGGFATPAYIPITITYSATAYATASGGAPFDIAALLNSVGPLDSGINPNDVIGIQGGSAAGHRVDNFALGAPTFNTSADAFTGLNKLSLATCPCTHRLWNGTTEIADGAITQTVTGFLIVLRGGRQ